VRLDGDEVAPDADDGDAPDATAAYIMTRAHEPCPADECEAAEG
jgi:hypothetical protein